MAPLARLPFTYNAQRALYDMTHGKGHPNYWDVAISPNLAIIHYSGNPKPWEVKARSQTLAGTGGNRTGDYLTDLWRQWYQRSKNFVSRYHKEQEKQAKEAAQSQQGQEDQSTRPISPKDVHKMVAKRFKELRQQGHSAKDAMAVARAEQGINDGEEATAGAQVASMFGLSGIL